jgi:hypothetical protein
MSIGKLKKVPLREIWRNEAKDFTTWLAENIDTLNEFLETNFSVVEREHSVGDFSLDIKAEDLDGQKVIIENQLEKTDHDHLGKLITYLSNLDAKTAIWISSNPREEHVKAVNWLNQFTPEDVSFYLIQIEAVKIGDSAPAPLFTIVAEPSEMTKEIGKEKKEYAEKHHLRKDFWSSLLEKTKGKTNLHSHVSPGMYHWIGAGAGRAGIGYNYIITNDYVSSEIYLDRGKGHPKLNKERFDELYKHKDEIERAFGGKLLWERLDKKRASRIAIRFKGYGLKNKDQWSEAQDRMIDSMVRLEKAFKPYIEKLA